MGRRIPGYRLSGKGSGDRISLGRFLLRFLATEASGGAALLLATLTALAWANLASSSYDGLWQTRLPFGWDIRHLIDKGLMSFFFLLVGLEIRRELTDGELQQLRKAVLPLSGAVGGMILPAIIYLGFNAGRPSAPGWGIPMATDIAFAVGVLSLLGGRTAPGLKIFLLTLAIADDIGAIAIIALFYSDPPSLLWMGAALATLGVYWGLGRSRVPALVLIGLAGIAWYATFRSGIHPTIAGVAVGLLTREPPAATTRVERLEAWIHPWTSFLILPLFALANAGVVLAGAAESVLWNPVVMGVSFGLIAGKTLGVFGAALVSLKLGAQLPDGVRLHDLLGVAALSGIGFTVSLFIATLSLEGAALQSAKFGVLGGSALSALMGASILVLATNKRSHARA